jgi:eukaryotic-like serine/threonine-protein kinase
MTEGKESAGGAPSFNEALTVAQPGFSEALTVARGPAIDGPPAPVLEEMASAPTVLSASRDAAAETASRAAVGPEARGAYAVTVLSPADSLVPLPAPPAPITQRSTVLPRVSLIGSEPTLIVEGKRRYEEILPLGKGGVGEVVRAKDNDIGRPVALKRLRPDMQSPSVLVRFVDEIRTTGRLEHPNIVPVHDVGLDEAGQYYFVMKYIDGETLESIIQKLAAGDPDYHLRYTFERRVQIFIGILDAVSFAHDKGILHRDIKPANVMVGAHGEVVVMDWGIARSLREPASGAPAGASRVTASAEDIARGRAFETQLGTVIGTPAYMSPEQASGAPLDERSDIYSLSVLFHELLGLTHYLAGRTTLLETLEGVQKEKPSPLYFTKHPHQGRVPPDLSWFVYRGLAKTPDQRHASVKEMQHCLLQRAEGKIPVHCGGTLLRRSANELGLMVDRHPFLMQVLVFGGLGLGLVMAAVRVFGG